MYLSIYFDAKLNEPGINLNGFLLKLAGKTYIKIIKWWLQWKLFRVACETV